MKLFGRTTKVAVGSAVLLALVLASNARAEEGTAKVQAIRSGAAQCSIDGITWSPLQEGTVLKQGTTVKTDTMGVVDLYLGKNGPLVRLTPATTLALNALSLDQGAGETVINTELGVTTGRIQGVVRKLSQSSRYEVKTPAGTCGIRGTKYEISATGRVSVEEGIVDVLYTPAGQPSPTKYEVQAGYTFDPALNNGKGGVIPTPANIRQQLQDDLRSMQSFVSKEERVQAWLPSPDWKTPERPFSPPGGDLGDQVPWVLQPVYNPTTAVVAPASGGTSAEGDK